MGYWTSGAVTIHACAPYRVRSVLDVLEEQGFGGGGTDNKTLNVGKPYSTNNLQCGGATDFAYQLIERAPEVAFTVYEEPAYEWIGTTYSYVPELGLFAAECDNSGEPMFTRSCVLDLEGKPDDVRQKRFGVPWLTAIAVMPDKVVVEPDRFATQWNRRHGEVVISATQCGGDLLVPASATAEQVDAVLLERGFQRADDWTQLDETGLVWRTDVYRLPMC